MTKEEQEKIGMTMEEKIDTGALVKREDTTARKKTKEEGKEIVIEVTVVEDQKKERAKMKKQDVLDVDPPIIWQPNALLTKKDPHQNARNASWTTLPTNARPNDTPITQKLKRRMTNNSK